MESSNSSKRKMKFGNIERLYSGKDDSPTRKLAQCRKRDGTGKMVRKNWQTCDNSDFKLVIRVSEK